MPLTTSQIIMLLRNNAKNDLIHCPDLVPQHLSTIAANRLEAKVVEINNIHNLNDFLLENEEKIAKEEGNFGLLEGVFSLFFDRPPAVLKEEKESEET